ncbi:MAG: hypothetical protein K8R31_01345 [Bacteroidales bacterium]|nr:hypothetical protein [Bacteroidales bacterium]
MKKIKYILIFILSLGIFNSCLIDDTSDIDLNADGYNVATFDRPIDNLTALANGDEYEFEVKVKIVGPTILDLTNDINVTFIPTAASTAVADVHYRIDNPTIVLSDDNNYLGYLVVTVITAGNTPPMDGTPEYDDYVAPMLYLEITTTGDVKVEGSGKTGEFTVNFIPPNPYAGLYDAHLIYRHPSLGDYPDNIYVDEVTEKELLAVTGRKCETTFATWPTDICWITVNADNTITFVVDDTWPYDVILGDPFDATKVTRYDPETGIIYLYYHYYGDGGPRIFWEVFTPKF